MANWTISGSVIVLNDKNEQVPNPTELTISALDEDVCYHDPLGQAQIPKEKSAYSISFSSSKFKNWWNFWEGNPDVIVTLFAPGRRVIARKSVGSITPGSTTVDFHVHHLHLENQWVSLPMASASKDNNGDPVNGKTPYLSHNNQIIPFIDNKTAWAAANEIARGATSDIALSQLSIDISPNEISSSQKQPRNLVMEFGNGTYPDTSGSHIGDVIADDVTCPARILVNARLMWSPPKNVAEYFVKKNKTDRVKVKSLTPPGISFMHAKNLIVDQKTAMILGSPLDQQYYNDSDHKIWDYRRGLQAERPRHDVSLQVIGPAVADLYNGFFSVHWKAAAPDDPLLPAAGTSGAGTCSVQVARSLSGGKKFPDCPDGEAGILEAYQRAIASAKKYIYLENQFITCPEIIDSLSLALEANETLEVILLVNIEYTPAEFFYSRYQNAAVTRLFQYLVKKNNNKEAWKRVGLFTKWSHGVRQDGSPELINNYIHAKVGIFDDTWAIVGSANLDGVSLLEKEYVRTSARDLPNDYSELEPPEKQERSSEISVAISDPSFVASLRQALFKDHLGADVSSPDGKWLALWKSGADSKLAGLKTAPNSPQACTVLPWPLDKKDDAPIPIANNKYWVDGLYTAPRMFVTVQGIAPTSVGMLWRLPLFDWNATWK